MDRSIRINVTFDYETYKEIKLLAHKADKSMSELVREWTIKGLNGEITQDNIEVLSPIIRKQVESCLNPQMERSYIIIFSLKMT